MANQISFLKTMEKDSGKINIIASLETKFPKNGWALIKTRQEKPFGYRGYMLTIYDIDDLSILYDIKGKRLKTLFNELIKLSLNDKKR